MNIKTSNVVRNKNYSEIINRSLEVDMDNYQKGRLYDRLDEDETMSDSEKRDAYFDAIAEQEEQEEYEQRW